MPVFGFRTVVSALILLVSVGLSGAGSGDDAVLLDIKGPIGPATSDYLIRGMEKAEERGVSLVIVRMDTPGGLDTSMREIIRAILASPVPVVSYVAPSGARAASAGTYISYASHIAAMAPGTNLGAATPVQIGGPGLPQISPDRTKDKSKDQKDSEETTDAPSEDNRPKATSSDKAVNDAVAYIRSLAQMRGRNVEWAENAVLSAATLTAEEALRDGVIDVVADDVPDLLAKVDGREVVVEGQTRRLETATLAIVPLEPDWRTELLAVITNPNVAYILMLIGIYGLLFEFYSPGLVGPGVIGAICLLLALYAFHVLPVDYTGLALIFLGLALIVAEVFMPSFGVIGIGGIAAFVIGSIMLMDTDVPGFTVAWQLIGSIAFFAGGTLFVVVMMLMRSRQRAVVSGPEEMIDSPGAVLDWAGEEGHVRIHGEVWRARGRGTITEGERVRVTRIDGLTLEVEPEPERR